MTIITTFAQRTMLTAIAEGHTFSGPIARSLVACGLARAVYVEGGACRLYLSERGRAALA